MHNRLTKVIAPLGLVLALFATQALAEEVFVVPAPLTPHPVAADQNGKIGFGVFSFGPDIEEEIMLVDGAAANLLQRQIPDTEDRVLVALVPGWKKASLMGAGLLGNKAVVDHFDAFIGSDKMINLRFFGKHQYHPATNLVVVLTEVDGHPIPNKCLAEVVVATIYQWSEVSADHLMSCMEASE